MSEQVTSAPVQPAFEDMSHSAQAHHLRTAHARSQRGVSPHVHRVLHEVADYARTFAELEPDAARTALELAAKGTPESWDAGVHTHRERA